MSYYMLANGALTQPEGGVADLVGEGGNEVQKTYARSFNSPQNRTLVVSDLIMHAHLKKSLCIVKQ